MFLKKRCSSFAFSMYFYLSAFFREQSMRLSRTKVVLFPPDENAEIFIRATAKDSRSLQKTANLAKQVEKMLLEDDKIVIGVRTSIGQESPRTASSGKPGFIPYRAKVFRRKRSQSWKQIRQDWQKRLNQMSDFEKARVIGGRFGFSSGSPIEIMIQENDDPKPS